MIKKAKKQFFGNPDKKIGDLVYDQFDQQFKVIDVTDNEIILERIPDGE